MKQSRFTFSFLVAVIMISGCGGSSDRLLVDVSGINISAVKIHRYDRDLFMVSSGNLREGLENIRNEYYFFLGTDLNNPEKLGGMKAYLENPRTIDFHKACERKYKDLTALEEGLTNLFRHWKYYFPNIRLPRVYTYISGGDYTNSVQLVDSVLIIALDTYLGKDFKPYLSDGVSLYVAERMEPDHIVPDVSREILNAMFPSASAPNTLLGAMVEAGKGQYFINALIPELPRNLQMNYTPAQYDWVKKNEPHVWSALVENKLLYSSDGQYFRMFLADGPYTMEFSKDSPPRLGEWIGYKIVHAYMQKNKDITLQDLMAEQDAQKILSQSGYKPEK